jgi:hypothetical protein
MTATKILRLHAWKELLLAAREAVGDEFPIGVELGIEVIRHAEAKGLAPGRKQAKPVLLEVCEDAKAAWDTKKAKERKASGGAAAQQGKGEPAQDNKNVGRRTKEPEKKLPDLPHKAAEEEVGLSYPPDELLYQCRCILRDVADRADSIHWTQEDLDDWKTTISGMRGRLRQIAEALDRTTKATLVERERNDLLKAVAVELKNAYGRNRKQAIAEWKKRTAEMGLGDKPGEGLSQAAYFDTLKRAKPNDNR